MTIDEILALTKAGFTKEDILQLASIQTEVPSDPKEEAAPEPPKEEPKEEPKKEPPKDDKRMDMVMEKLDKLSSGMESLALKGTRMPERETVDDTLARIINPYISTTGNGGLNNGSK